MLQSLIPTFCLWFYYDVATFGALTWLYFTFSLTNSNYIQFIIRFVILARYNWYHDLQSLELWNMTENKTMTLSAHEGLIAALAVSTVNGLVASASHDKFVKLWKWICCVINTGCFLVCWYCCSLWCPLFFSWITHFT